MVALIQGFPSCRNRPIVRGGYTPLARPLGTIPVSYSSRHHVVQHCTELLVGIGSTSKGGVVSFPKTGGRRSSAKLFHMASMTIREGRGVDIFTGARS